MFLVFGKIGDTPIQCNDYNEVENAVMQISGDSDAAEWAKIWARDSFPEEDLPFYSVTDYKYAADTKRRIKQFLVVASGRYSDFAHDEDDE